MEARFCHICGAKLPENTKFCGKCGTPALHLPDPAPPVPKPEPEAVPDTAAVPAAAPEAADFSPAEPAFPEVSAAPAEPEVCTEPEPIAAEETPVPKEPEPIAAEEVPAPAEPEPIAAEEVPAPAEPEPVPAEEVPAPAEPEPIAAEEVPAPAEPEPVPAEEIPAPTEPEPVPAEPVVVMPEPVVAVSKNAARKPANSRGVWRSILAVLLCLVIFVWSFSALTLFHVRRASSDDVLTDTITKISETAEPAEFLASNVVISVWDTDLTLTDWVAEIITAAYGDTVRFTDKDVERYLERSCVPQFLFDKLSAYTEDLLQDTGASGVTQEELMELLEEDADVIEDAFDVVLTEEDITYISSVIHSSGLLSGLDVATMKADSPLLYSAVYVFTSYWFIIVLAVLAVITMLLLAQVNKWNMLRTCGDIGITLTVVSVLLTLPGLFTMLLPDLWISLWGSQYTAGSLIGSVLTHSVIPNVIVLGCGIVLILVQVIGRLVANRRARK